MPHTLTLENGTTVELPATILDMGPGDPVDFWTLPSASLAAYAKEANTHVFGNRASSDLVRVIKLALAGEGGKAADVTGEAVKAFRADPANAAQIEKSQSEIAASYRDKVLSGELAVSSRTPGMSAETKASREAAKRTVAYLLGQLKPARVLPTGKGAPTIVAEFIDNFLADKNGVMTKNQRRYNTILAEVKAEMADAGKPKAALDDIFGADESEQEAAQ